MNKRVETIIVAAVRQFGLTITLPPPARHGTIMEPLHKWTDIVVSPFDQGFLTSTGRFVGRGEAAEIAMKAGQIDMPQCGPDLYSEDIW